MARTVKVFPMASLPAELFGAIHSYLTSEGYKYMDYHQERIFKKGKGVASGPTFIKVSYQNNVVRLEGWMKFAWAPGVYSGESGVYDALGFAAKGPLKRRFEQIEVMIQQYIANHPAVAGPVRQAPPAPPQPGQNWFCTNCGTRLVPGGSFCPSCGKPV